MFLWPLGLNWWEQELCVPLIVYEAVLSEKAHATTFPFLHQCVALSQNKTKNQKLTKHLECLHNKCADTVTGVLKGALPFMELII